MLFLGCSDNGGDPPVVQKPEPVKPPVAVNDQVSAIEDDETIISGLIDNDKDATNARITDVEITSAQNGTIVDNRDGTYTYEPTEGFTGEDSFTYTLCDREATPNCSTGTVSITVQDEGTPIAINDEVFMIKNSSITIENILDNDMLLDDSTLTSITIDATLGNAILNSNGTISYTAQSEFVGEDVITYTLCDDDETPTCVNGSIIISVLEEGTTFNIPTDLVYYYNDLLFTDNIDVNYNLLKEHVVKNHTTILSYGQRHAHLYNADADESNTDNVVLMYSGESRFWEEYTSGTNPYGTQTFNTEHIYPQSKLVSEEAVTDLHHLRACDALVNEDRSNFPYTSGSGAYTLSNEMWYPGDDWRGDVARMVMYVNVRYQEEFSKVGTLELFLEWNAIDPVSSFEIQRNNVIEGAQGNRNPFVDNPYLATLIWGGTPANNLWE